MHLSANMILAAISVATLWTVYANVCTICSFLHATLPPFEFLNDFPRAQAAYKAFVYVIGFIALNARSTLYKSISTDNGTKISQASQTSQTNGTPKP